MRRLQPSPSALALVIAAFVAVIQAALVAAFLAAQRNAAHIVDVSAAQRTRAEHIDLLATQVRAGVAPADWHAQLLATIAAVLSVRREIAAFPNLASGPRGADGKTPLERLSDPFVAAALRFAANPHDDAAFRYLHDREPALARAFDATIEMRVARLGERNDTLVLGIIASVLLQLLIIDASWLTVAKPAERRARALLDDATREREQMQSLFDENPDAIGVYDENGVLIRVNAARVALLGESAAEQVGRHLDTFIAPDSVDAAHRAFERVKAGESLDLSIRKVAAKGEIEVETTIFPNMVDGKLAGVVTVSRDVTELRLAQRLYAEQACRIEALYAVAAARGKTSRERIAAALRLASTQLGYGWSALIEIDDGTATVVACTGEPHVVDEGFRYDLDIAVDVSGERANVVWNCDDVEASPLRASISRWLPFGAIAGAPIVADGRAFGVFGVASEGARTVPLSDADRHFIRLVAALLGSIIENDNREQRLNSLAFFDVLTGLPNRAMLHDRLGDALQTARRRNGRLAVYYVDLDRFKEINDTYGHDAGDELLRLAAARLRACVRETDLVARLSGDEFVVAQAGGDHAEDLARRIIAALSMPYAIAGQVTTLGASVGIAYFPSDGSDAADVLAAADRALYEAKREGRGRFKLARPAVGVA